MSIPAAEYRKTMVEHAGDQRSGAAVKPDMSAIAGGRLKVLIVCTLFTIPYRVMRTCAAAGATVYVIGNQISRGLRLSRFCSGFELSSVAFDGTAPEDAAAEINRFIAVCGADMVLPGDAPTTRLLCLLQDRIAAACFPLPSIETFDLLNNKWEFTQLAGRLGIPCPATRLFADAAALRTALAGGEIRLPAIAKPLSADGSIGIVTLDAAGAPERAATIDYAPILVQDFIEGEDIGASIFALDGEVRGHITHRLKRRTYSVIDDPRVIDNLSLMTSRLGLSGVFNFDMRLTADGWIYYLECNPRFFYKMDLSMIAGVNFAGLGLPGMAMTVPVTAPSGTRVRLPKALAADLITPMNLTSRDWGMLRYLWSDPVPYLRERLGIDGED